MHSAFITGNLCHDPETKQLEGGNAICKLRVAIKSERKDDPQDFMTVEVWGKRGEWAGDSLGKGAKVACSGTVYLNEWEVSRGEHAGEKRKEQRMRCSQLEATGEWKPNQEPASTADQHEEPEDRNPF